MEKKECPEKSRSSEEELPRPDRRSSRNVDASKLIRIQGPWNVLVDNSIRELQHTKTGIFSQAEACVTDDT
nr:caspase recruitment domain-containing protein 8 isoform X9 [Symphalangus syndactylus]